MQNFIEIRLIIKDFDQKHLLDIIKGHNSVVSEWNYPSCNTIPVLSDTNSMRSLKKIGKKGTKVRAQKLSAKHMTYIKGHFLCGGV